MIRSNWEDSSHSTPVLLYTYIVSVCVCECVCVLYTHTQAYFRDIVGSIADHCSKVNIAIKQVTQILLVSKYI